MGTPLDIQPVVEEEVVVAEATIVFTETVDVISLQAYGEQTWVLPNITIANNYPLDKISIEPDNLIAPCIKFESETRTVTYTGCGLIR